MADMKWYDKPLYPKWTIVLVCAAIVQPVPTNYIPSPKWQTYYREEGERAFRLCEAFNALFQQHPDVLDPKGEPLTGLNDRCHMDWRILPDDKDKPRDA